jgi:hypothetical protein
MSLAYRRTGSFARVSIIVAIAALLQSCGGGSGGNGNGGNGNGNGSGNDTTPGVTANTTTVTESAEAGALGPSGFVTLTVTNPPDEGLFVAGQFSTNGIETIDLVTLNETQAQVVVYFRLPGSLQDGTYDDDIGLQICLDDACDDEIRGSPLAITTHYTVSGGRAATIDRDTVELEVDSQDSSNKRETIRVTLDEFAEGGFHVEAEPSTNAILDTFVANQSQTEANVDVTFMAGTDVGTGAHDDTVTIRVCYEPTCARQLEGSPFTVTTRLTVSVGAEPDVDPMPFLSRVALPHDVVDVEFDKALNALVMVSNQPSNAIHVYDVATGVERSQALPKRPMAVSIAPDGQTAAVGHDALVSVFDLTTVGQTGAPDPTLLNVSSDMFDIVIDGNGFVHAFPLTDQWVQPHSIEIATNTETLGNALIYDRTRARLHPNGQWIYTADNGLSPSDIAKLDITSGTAEGLYDSPYHGDYGMCGDLWFSEDGQTIYTACGNTFRSSADQAQDMIYTGGLELSPSDLYGWHVRSLSQSAADEEIALIEAERYACEILPGDVGPCYTHLALYESQFLNKLATYAIGPVTVDGQDYAQHGLFVFHDPLTGHKLVIGKALGSPDPLQAYFLSVVE